MNELHGSDETLHSLKGRQGCAVANNNSSNNSSNITMNRLHGDPMRHLERKLAVIPFRLYSVWLTFVFSLANAADAVELMCVSYLIPSAACDLNMGPGRKGLLSAASFAGMMMGGLVWGYGADSKGRRPALLTSLFVNAAAGAVSSFTPTFLPFLLMRFLAAVGVGGSIPVVWTYFAEFLPMARRGTILSLVSSSWMIGSVSSACLALYFIPKTTGSAFLNSGWRHFALVSALPAFVCFLFALTIPESAKFLLKVGNVDECVRTLKLLARYNSAEGVISKNEQTLKEDLMETATTEPEIKQSGIHNLLLTRDQVLKHTRNQLLLIVVVLGLLCYGYYGLLMWLPDMLTHLEMVANSTDPSKFSICYTESPNADINSGSCIPPHTVFIDSIIIAAASLPGNIVTIALMDVVGRRLLLIPSMLASGLTVVLMMLTKSRAAAIVFASLFSATSVIPFNTLTCLGTELFPTEYRSSAVGLQYVCGRVGAIVAALTFGYLSQVYCTLPLLIVAANFFAGGFLSWWLDETKGIAIN